MAIIKNVPCPSCREMGHDHRGTNMIVFENGARFCNRSHWHRDGLPLYIPADGADPFLDMEIDGTVKYTVEQFDTLRKEGKLDNSVIREIALSGMRGADRWSVCTEDEKAAMLKELNADKEYFEMLKIKNLVSRHIPGQVAKFYNVRVGSDTNGKTTRHYYPIYDFKTREWKGAKCRTLPKDFYSDHLGWLWGDNLMFGQKQTTDVIATGARMDTLLLCAGECDVMAAQTMLLEAEEGTKWANTYYHIWSPTKGEHITEILLNKEEIKKFKKIIVCFDNDEVGDKLNKDVGKVFRGKVFKLALPAGCKDTNDALKQGRGKEFVQAWWQPIDIFKSGTLASPAKYRDKAKVMPTMGLSWPWPSMNPVTYGMRLNYLSVWGGGTGTGKTKTTKEVVFHLAYMHDKPVVVIYLEEQAVKTVRSFAGNLINKDLTAPPCNDKSDPNYSSMRDYTEEEANAAIDRLCDDGHIMIGDLEGRKDVESVMEVMEEAMALGYENFIIDNLTAFEHKGAEGKRANKVDSIDETMKRLGSFKDENPVFIMLLSHLKKVYGDHTPHEEGGRVSIQDFRGAGSITFWANDVWGIARNTVAESFDEKCLTTFECLKNRDVGYKAGTKVYARLDFNTGRLVETEAPVDRNKFDDGTKTNKQTKTGTKTNKQTKTGTKTNKQTKTGTKMNKQTETDTKKKKASEILLKVSHMRQRRQNEY